MRPEISLVLGTRNRPQSWERFARSVGRTATVDTEIVVTDASDPEQYGYVFSPDFDEAFCEKVTLHMIREWPRLGPVRGYNVAFRRAHGRYVVYVNDDCEMLPGWDRTAIDFMDANLGVGCGALYFREGKGPWYVQSFQQLVYANLGVVRREAGEQVDWFDEREIFIPALNRVERLVFYGNDVSLSYKLIDADWGVVPIPGCRVEHYREQDEARAQNSRDFLSGPHGNIAGMVLRELWGGDEGYARLRGKHAKFNHLVSMIDRNGNVTA